MLLLLHSPSSTAVAATRGRFSLPCEEEEEEEKEEEIEEVELALDSLLEMKLLP